MLRQFEIYLQPNAVVMDKVMAIKAIRTISGLGLKEAKDISDAAQNGQRPTFEEQDPKYRSNPEYVLNIEAELANIRKAGYSVVEFTYVNFEILEKVKGLSLEAIAAEEFGVAISLLEILKAQKTR